MKNEGSSLVQDDAQMTQENAQNNISVRANPTSNAPIEIKQKSDGTEQED